MSTTAVFVELLVSGVQASIWVALLVLSFTGINWVQTILPQLEKWDALVTAFVFAAWYSLGIIVDRFARILFMVFDPASLIRKTGLVNRQIAKTAADFSHVEIATKAGDVREYLEYFRSRARIVRATIFNSLLTIIAAITFVYAQCGYLGCVGNQNRIIALVVGIGIVILICASISAGMLELAYQERVAQAQELARRSTDK